MLYFMASVQTQQGSYLASWIPHDAAGANIQVFTAPVLPDAGAFGGSPVQIGQRIVVPGTRADVFVSEFDPSLRIPRQATIKTGVVVPDSIPALAVGDLIVRSNGNVPPKPLQRLITQAGLTQTGEVFYPIDSDFPAGATGLDAYDVSNTLPGTFASPDKLTLDANDLETQVDDWLLIENKFYTVDELDNATIPWIAKISSPTGDPMPASGTYVRPITTGGRMAPFMNLDPATNGDWDAGLLSRVRLMFPDEDPDRQTAKAFSVALGNKPVIVVLAEEFQPPVNDPAEFVVDAAVGEWQRLLGDTSTNPELSWEYWNGKGWWGLDVTSRWDAESEDERRRAIRGTRRHRLVGLGGQDQSLDTRATHRRRLRPREDHDQVEDGRRRHRADDRPLVGRHSSRHRSSSFTSPTASAKACSRRSCWRRTADRCATRATPIAPLAPSSTRSCRSG